MTAEHTCRYRDEAHYLTEERDQAVDERDALRKTNLERMIAAGDDQTRLPERAVSDAADAASGRIPTEDVSVVVTCTRCGRRTSVYGGQLAVHFASRPGDRFVQYGVLCAGSAARQTPD